ncbi:MAG: stage III sporulation protein AD [Bacillota bacterium]
MSILQAVGFALVAVALIVVVKQQQPAIAVLLSLAAGLILFIIAFDKLRAVLDTISTLAERAGVGSLYLSTIFKVVGIAYVAEFGAQICRDAEQGALANKVEFVGKVIIMVLAVPIVMLVMDSVLQLLP